jgi:flagellar biosynthesis/type III secretory pathway chaperone
MQSDLSNRKETLFNALLTLMEKQTELYESLKDALRDEKERITKVDFEGIRETSERKEMLFGKIRRLEGNRVRLMEDFSKVLKIPYRGLTVNKLMSHARGSQKDHLRKSREGLLDLAGRIRKMNKFNKLLLDHSLKLITVSYSFLRQLAARDAVYQSSGGLRLRQQSGKFISNSI